MLRVSGVDVKVADGLTVGYIAGSGDDVPASLENLGVHVTFLAPSDVASADLSKYSVILLGVRAYAARDELKTYNSRLLEYVKNGGVMIVQYNTPEFDHNFGPYPYEMGSNPEEVTDETSKMEILDPKNPVFLLAQPDYFTRFRRLGRRARFEISEVLGFSLRAAFSTKTKDRSRKKAGCFMPDMEKAFISTMLMLLSAITRRRPRGFPAVCKLNQSAEKSDLK